MSLQIGIVGLPNVGKSTLFNALTQAGAAVASYPFTTIEPNVGVVEVADPRLQKIAEIVQPDETKSATIEFVDIAGLVKGAHQGEGLGNQFLGHIRTVDAIAMVVRCFTDTDVAHVSANLDPVSDWETIDLELVLADLATIDRRREKVETMAKAQPKEHAAELVLLDRIHAYLDGGGLAREIELSAQEAEVLLPLNLLTSKPCLLIANVSESQLPEGGPLAKNLLEQADAKGVHALALCAQLEADLADWPKDEATEYRGELGLRASGLDRLVHAGYDLLDLVTFFTATGTKVVRAWTIERGQAVHTAAGKIHTDMQRGFIRAEVISCHDLVSAGTFARAREKGLLRLEGKEYVVQDGDVVHIRFSAPR